MSIIEAKKKNKKKNMIINGLEFEENNKKNISEKIVKFTQENIKVKIEVKNA